MTFIVRMRTLAALKLSPWTRNATAQLQLRRVHIPTRYWDHSLALLQTVSAVLQYLCM